MEVKKVQVTITPNNPLFKYKEYQHRFEDTGATEEELLQEIADGTGSKEDTFTITDILQDATLEIKDVFVEESDRPHPFVGP